MKRIYWRPSRVSRLEALLLAAICILGLVLVEVRLTEHRAPYYHEKVEAARLAQRAFDVIKGEHAARGIAFDKHFDTTHTGLLGVQMTPITTTHARLQAKIASINPDFAALFVQFIKDAGLHSQDTVAVGISGSFPALDIAMLAALQTLQVRALVISSVGASQWGANDPNFTFPDMWQTLVKSGVLTFMPIAATRGGMDDRALGLNATGRQLLDAAIERNKIPMLNVQNYAESVEQRMDAYNRAAGGAPIKAYINVGGGTTSVGTYLGKHAYRPGLNMKPAPGAPTIDSVMERFVMQDVPVIHITNVLQLAEKHGLPEVAQEANGETSLGSQGAVYHVRAYSMPQTLLVLGAIAGTMFLFSRSDLAFAVRRRRDPTT